MPRSSIKIEATRGCPGSFNQSLFDWRSNSPASHQPPTTVFNRPNGPVVPPPSSSTLPVPYIQCRIARMPTAAGVELKIDRGEHHAGGLNI
jgi:hypothetical protein